MAKIKKLNDPDLSLFKLYEIECCGGKLMKGMFNRAMGEKEKVYLKKIEMVGNANRICADFIIDEKKYQ